MRQLFLDLGSGVAGDMLVAALLDLGRGPDPPPETAGLEEVLERTLAGLPGGEFEATWRREERHGIAGLRFEVQVREEAAPHRHLPELRAVLQGADLTDGARRLALEALEALARAEARVHDRPLEEVHLHEAGGTDALVDLACAAALFDHLAVGSVRATPVATGSGRVQCAHGILPVPAPGTLELLRGMPLSGRALEGERTTPTGAALLRAFGPVFDPGPPAAPQAVGYGLGRRDPADRANLLRAVLEEVQGEDEELVEFRTLVDDLPGEILGAAREALAAAPGIVEVWTTAVLGRKGRPAWELALLAEAARAGAAEELLFRHLGTLGLRRQGVWRRRRPRSLRPLDGPLGPLPWKCREDGLPLKPEFEALCERAAEAGLTPWEAWRRLQGAEGPEGRRGG